MLLGAMGSKWGRTFRKGKRVAIDQNISAGKISGYFFEMILSGATPLFLSSS